MLFVSLLSDEELSVVYKYLGKFKDLEIKKTKATEMNF